MTDLEIEQLADEEMLKMHTEDASSDELLDNLTDLPDIDLVDVESDDALTDLSSTEISSELLDDLELDTNELDPTENEDDQLPELEELNADSDEINPEELEDVIQGLNEDIDDLITSEESPAPVATQEDEEKLETTEAEVAADLADDLDSLNDLSDEIAAEASHLEEDLELDDLALDDLANSSESLETSVEETEVQDEIQSEELEEALEAEASEEAIEASEFINPNPAIDQMQEALELKDDTDEIASSLKETAKDVTKLAAATALQAQEAADQVQKDIQNTFIATERAFETIKKAGYLIDSSNLDELSDDELNEKLEKITQRNNELKQANEAIKQRLAALKR